MVLRDDDSLAIHAWRNLDKHSARFAVRSNAGEGMVVHGHLDGGKLGGAFDPRLHIRRNAHMHVLGARRTKPSEAQFGHT
jgi:hypothetical protein